MTYCARTKHLLHALHAIHFLFASTPRAGCSEARSVQNHPQKPGNMGQPYSLLYPALSNTNQPSISWLVSLTLTLVLWSENTKKRTMRHKIILLVQVLLDTRDFSTQFSTQQKLLVGGGTFQGKA